jgi:UDP-GlcNAc:undecaprenyl-phosphate/decaprenyl-phosphate GlcNAc-1-phosphate transferase
MKVYLLYAVSAILLTGVILAYFRIANHYQIVDKPNERSSHNYTTYTAGGIIFAAAALLWFLLFGFEQPWFMLGLVMIAVISFLDDIISLSSIIRISFHITAVTLMFWQINIFRLHWPYVFAAYVFAIGWINAFNFMDGINGILAFYSLVALGTFWWVNQSIVFASNDLIIISFISVLIFTFFNARKRARTFAGDVGSISMAFILACLMASLMNKTDMVVYMLFFAVYGIDSVITILFRMNRNENIFQAHRTHLYQYMSNELGWPQLSVSAIYAAIQLVVNIVTIFMLHKGMMNKPRFIVIFGVLTLIYLTVRYRVQRKITALQKMV